jgi:hypothetical protein
MIMENEKITKEDIEFDDEMTEKYYNIYEKIVKGQCKPESAIKKLFKINNDYHSARYLAEDFKRFFIYYYSNENDGKLLLKDHHMKSLDNFQKYIDKMIKAKSKLELLYQIYDQIKNYKM